MSLQRHELSIKRAVQLQDLQQFLADLYQLEMSADIRDFLVTDRDFLEALTGPAESTSDEMLLIRQATAVDESNDSIDVSLFLDADMLARLMKTDPGAHFKADNLNDFCIVFEGVSHFVYLLWNAVQNKCITQLELEVQAEIDKYIATRLLLESQATSALAQNILPSLFESVAYRDDLSPERLQRYKQANRFAAHYCYSLEQRYPQSAVSASMVNELRDVYRMPQTDKLSYIRTAHYI